MKINNVYSVQLFACINHTFMQLIFYAFLNFTINADLEVSSTILNRPRMVSIKVRNSPVLCNVLKRFEITRVDTKNGVLVASPGPSFTDC